MIINYDIEELNKALEDFYNATGINISLINEDITPIASTKKSDTLCSYMQSTADGIKKCFCSDKKLIEKCKKSRCLERHICHAGLIDTAVPIIHNDSIIGYIILGQMRSDIDFEDIYSNISYLDLKKDTLKNKYENLPYCNTEKIQSIGNIALMLTNYILFKNMLKPSYDSVLNSAVVFIQRNLSNDISVEDICKTIGTSKSVLYSTFRRNFNSTVGEYINNERVKKAKQMLISNNSSIMHIAEAVGYSNKTYFCKIFKKLTGTTPLKFRKSNL